MIFEEVGYNFWPHPTKDEWLNDQFQQISLVLLSLIEDKKLNTFHAEPAKVQQGQIVFADGTDWNPGSGRGVYVYDEIGPLWRYLG